MSVHMFSVCNLHDNHCLVLVLDRIDDAIIALPDSVAFPGRQLLRSRRARDVGKFLDSADDSLDVLLGDPVQVLADGFAEQDAISGHAS